MRTVIYLDVLLLVNFVVGAAFLLAAGLLCGACCSPPPPHRPLAAGPYI